MKKMCIALLLVLPVPAVLAATGCGDDPGAPQPMRTAECDLEVYLEDLKHLHRNLNYASCRLLEASGDLEDLMAVPSEDAAHWSERYTEALDYLVDPDWQQRLAECSALEEDDAAVNKSGGEKS